MCSEHAVDEDIVFAWEVICDSAEQVLHDCDEVMYTDALMCTFISREYYQIILVDRVHIFFLFKISILFFTLVNILI